MKKCICLFFCFTILTAVLFTGCKQSSQQIVSNIRLSTEKANYETNTDQIKIILTNKSKATIEFGCMYNLKKYDGKSWKNVQFRDNTGFTTECYNLAKNRNYSQKVDFNLFDYKFGKGKYRVIKYYNIEGDGTEYTVSCDFNIL